MKKTKKSSVKRSLTVMPKIDSWIGPPRYACTVLDEMRVCLKHLNLAMFPSLIEELQIIVNRMETSLGTERDIITLTKDIHNLKDARKKIKKEVEELIKRRDIK